MDKKKLTKRIVSDVIIMALFTVGHLFLSILMSMGISSWTASIYWHEKYERSPLEPESMVSVVIDGLIILAVAYLIIFVRKSHIGMGVILVISVATLGIDSEYNFRNFVNMFSDPVSIGCMYPALVNTLTLAMAIVGLVRVTRSYQPSSAQKE